jgi:hypothetical protein
MEFSEALEQIFGLGASYLQILIMKNLHQKAYCELEIQGSKRRASQLTFVEYIESTRVCYEIEGKKEKQANPITDNSNHQ